MSTEIEPLHAIHLSFDNSEGGAWDDRELICAYDSAISEFHAHHPGPGSWLDKATAALAKGQPLPGANGYDTPWYTASFTGTAAELASAANMPSQSEDIQPTPKRARIETAAEGSAKKPKTSKPQAPKTKANLNPYAPVTNGPVPNRNRGESPNFVPPSPSADPTVPQHAQMKSASSSAQYTNNGNTSKDRRHTQPHPHHQSPTQARNSTRTQSQNQPRPDSRSQSTPYQTQDYTNSTSLTYPTTHITSSLALSHAMTAQYWAGYWMGVARGKIDSAFETGVVEGEGGWSGGGDGYLGDGDGYLRNRDGYLGDEDGYGNYGNGYQNMNGHMGDDIGMEDEEGVNEGEREAEGEGERPTNLFVTQQHFAQPGMRGNLRR